MKPNGWIAFLSFFIFLNTLLFYGFVRDGTWLVLAVLSIFVYRKIGRPNFLLVSVSFLAVTLVLIAGVHFFLREGLYYRPYEMLNTVDWDGLPVFKKNQTVEMQQQHGDIKTLAKPEDVFEIQPRRVRYTVDSFGFRNDRDYHGQQFILVGDSFIAGSGTTQEDTVNAQLLSRHGADTYNLGITGGVREYLNNIEKFEKRYGSNFKALVFLYEGNDFSMSTALDRIGTVQQVKNFYKKYLNIYKSLFRRTDLYRYTYMAYASFRRDLKQKSPVHVHQVGSHQVGFLASPEMFRIGQYPKPYFEDRLIAMRDKIAALIFIPTKLRVYAGIMQPPLKETLPNPFGDYLNEFGKRTGMPVIDLTGPMIAASKHLLKEKDQLTFWTDDTHWNGHGMAVAARVACEQVRPLGCNKPPNSPAS